MTKHNLIFFPYSQRLKVRSKYLKKIILLLLYATFISYPKDVHSNICSQIFNQFQNRQEKSAEKKMGPIRQKILGFVNPKKIEDTISEQLDLENSPDAPDFFKQHLTETAFSDNQTIVVASVEPITLSASEQADLKKKIKDYIQIRRQFRFSELSSEFLTKYTKALVFLISQYLAANGVSHIVIDQIPKTKKVRRKFTIRILPNRDTQLGRLAQDFYNNYNKGGIVYDPLTLILEHGSASYNTFINIINLPEPQLLNPNTRHLLTLHELLHAKIENNRKQNPENPYLLSVTYKKTDSNGYQYLSVSEMIAYQQTIRILLRQLIVHSESTAYEINLEYFIQRVFKILTLTEKIETALSETLSLLDQRSTNPNLKKPVSVKYLGEPLFQVPFTNTSFLSVYGPHSEKAYFNIPVHRKGFDIQIPFEHTNDDVSLRELIKKRLESALEITRAHKSRYLVVADIARRIQKRRTQEFFYNGFFYLPEREKQKRREKNRQTEILLLRALQAHQVLSQRFNSEIQEESEEQLLDRVLETAENLQSP